ncbi:MAG: DNA replication/repair protein RecF [Devosia sp.]
MALAPHEEPARQTRLTRLSLTDFRNYRGATVSVSGQHVVLTGPNGAGKTNVLEAVSLFSPGRGLRRAAYSAMIRREGEPAARAWALHAKLARDGEEWAIGTGYTDGASGRQVRIDGDDGKADDLTALVRILWLTPAMDGLFTGGPSDRRRFLDRLALALNPQHGRRANAYERAMRQRNKMMDEGVRDPAWFDAVEKEMADHGIALTLARTDLVDRLNAAQSARADDDTDFPKARLTLADEMDATDAIAFAAKLAEVRPRDRAAGRALLGPHRADLTVVHVEKDMPAALASTGEQKALLIGLVLGHAALVAEVSGDTPILLLDEVAAHLDPSRRAALYETLDKLGAQTVMTGTDDALFSALGEGVDRFHVTAGRIEPA